MTTVKTIMTQGVSTTTPNTPLSETCKHMWEVDCGVIPVVEPGSRRLAGIVTDRDACMAAYTQGRSLSEIPTRVAMTVDVRTCRPDDELHTAEATMRKHQVRRLPVIDAKGDCVGLLSMNDLACAATESRKADEKVDVAETLSAICRHRQRSMPQVMEAAGA